MNNQLSFGVERDVLVDELQYYFEQANAADLVAKIAGIREISKEAAEELIHIYSGGLKIF